MNLALDHVVVAARSLAEGVAWCEATLGVTPGPGGQHLFMGTHNRLLSIASPQFARSYLEIIAIDPQAARPSQPRWFDLDAPATQAAMESGPQLWHWVARSAALDEACDTLRKLGVDPGELVQAQRETAQGTLRWRITIRPDGRLLCAGAVPTLIEWSGAHPVESMQASGVQLCGFSVGGVPGGLTPFLPAGIESIGGAIGTAAPLQIELITPLGRVQLCAGRTAA